MPPTLSPGRLDLVQQAVAEAQDAVHAVGEIEVVGGDQGGHALALHDADQLGRMRTTGFGRGRY